MSAGEYILGDFGPALELGKHIHEQTSTHWPAQLENPRLSLEETSAAIDFFQLVITLLQRTGCLTLTHYPTTAKCREAIAKLQSTELATFTAELLQHQAL